MKGTVFAFELFVMSDYRFRDTLVRLLRARGVPYAGVTAGG